VTFLNLGHRVHIADIELLINYTAGQFVAGLRRTRGMLITFEASSSTTTGRGMETGTATPGKAVTS